MVQHWGSALTLYLVGKLREQHISTLARSAGVSRLVEQSVGISSVDPLSMTITQVTELDMYPQIITCCLT